MPQTIHQDEQFMRRAIRLAMNGRGRVEPNPMVGCVIVKDRAIIGEGWHKQFGGPHAEPNALEDCAVRGHGPRGATAYVTLEPCCHATKKTPPCAPRVIQAGIRRVVIGCVDPYHEVNGGGVALLRSAGIQVDQSSLEPEARQLLAPFIAHVQHGCPYVTLKWAQTADAMVAGAGTRGLVQGKRLQITNPASTKLVHHLRATSDAILVGANTIRADDPKLTARGVATPRKLLRAGLASRNGLFLNAQLAGSVDEGPVLLYCTKAALDAHCQSAQKLLTNQVSVQPLAATADGMVDLRAVLADLHTRDVTHLMVEPGPTLAASFLTDNLVDRLWVFQSAVALNQPARLAAPVPPDFIKTGQLDLEGDTLSEYLNPRSTVFFAPTASADFVLATAPEYSS